MKKPWCQNRDRQKKEQDDSALRFAIGSNPCSEFRDKSVCCFAVRCDPCRLSRRHLRYRTLQEKHMLANRGPQLR